mgnify:CR=1 FL=1
MIKELRPLIEDLYKAGILIDQHCKRLLIDKPGQRFSLKEILNPTEEIEPIMANPDIYMPILKVISFFK